VTTGSVKAPTPEQLRDVAAELGMSFDDTQLEAHMAALLPVSPPTTSLTGCRTRNQP
jgi:hypothetical protein